MIEKEKLIEILRSNFDVDNASEGDEFDFNSAQMIFELMWVKKTEGYSLEQIKCIIDAEDYRTYYFKLTTPDEVYYMKYHGWYDSYGYGDWQDFEVVELHMKTIDVAFLSDGHDLKTLDQVVDFKTTKF